MAINQCTVTGTIVGPDGAGIIGAEVKAYFYGPFIHPADDSMIVDYQVSTMTDENGDWSMDLIETETAQATMNISFLVPMSLNGAMTTRLDYSVTIPDAASATFASLLA